MKKEWKVKELGKRILAVLIVICLAAESPCASLAGVVKAESTDEAVAELSVSSGYTLKENKRVKTLTVTGGTLDLNGYSLTVEEDAVVSNGACVNLNKGTLYCRGSLTFGDTSCLKSTSPNDQVIVDGDFTAAAPSNYWNETSLSRGTLTVRGDFIQSAREENCGIRCSGDYTVVFAGEKEQTVTLASPCNRFGTVVFQNYSKDGIRLASPLCAETMIENQSTVSYPGDDYEGSSQTVLGGDTTLEEDTVYPGDVVWTHGTLDLNGHKLTVKGDLIQPGGSVVVSGGSLGVDGDYRMQVPVKKAVGEEETISYDYTYGNGILVMQKEEDQVGVG